MLKHTQPHAKHTFVILPDLRGTNLPKRKKIKKDWASCSTHVIKHLSLEGLGLRFLASLPLTAEVEDFSVWGWVRRRCWGRAVGTWTHARVPLYSISGKEGQQPAYPSACCQTDNCSKTAGPDNSIFNGPAYMRSWQKSQYFLISLSPAFLENSFLMTAVGFHLCSFLIQITSRVV